jgi:hypothetical protein
VTTEFDPTLYVLASRFNERLGVAKITVYSLIRRGRLEAEYIDGILMIRKDVADEFANQYLRNKR